MSTKKNANLSFLDIQEFMIIYMQYTVSVLLYIWVFKTYLTILFKRSGIVDAIIKVKARHDDG